MVATQIPCCRGSLSCCSAITIRLRLFRATRKECLPCDVEHNVFHHRRLFHSRFLYDYDMKMHDDENEVTSRV